MRGPGFMRRTAAGRWCFALAILVGCGGASGRPAADSGPGDGGGDGGVGDGGAYVRTLGLNDVTILVPLASPVLLRASDLADDGNPMIPRTDYDRLDVIPGRGPTLLEDVYPTLQVFGVRFDLCDRIAPGPCPDSDGRLRLVFQGVRPGTTPPTTFDAAFHAFYTIPRAELAALVTELRALSRLQGAPLTSPLGVSPALTAQPSGAYATRVRRLITRYGGASHLQRLTFFAQPSTFSAIRWVFRGMEQQGGSFVDISIPGLAGTLQEATLQGNNSFDVMPVVDQPRGFVLATSETAFAAAAPGSQREALEALAATDNPLASTPNTIQCVTCHIATHVLHDRATAAGVAPDTLSSRYLSAYDLTVAPISELTLRAFGWLRGTPLIAQRTANESAQVALEMDTRFPE